MAKHKKRAELVAVDKVGPEEFARQHADKVGKLTVRFLALRDQLSRDAVETMREMGSVLERGAKLLPRRLYGQWLDEELGVGRSAAQNYRRVAELSLSTPAVFLDAKDLGMSKMIRLSRMHPQKRKLALSQKHRGRSVHEMTDAEFALATKKYMEKRRLVTGNMRAHGLRMKLRSMNASLAEAMSYPRADNRDIRAALSTEFADLIRIAKSLRQKVR